MDQNGERKEEKNEKKKDSGEKKGNTRKYYFNTCTNQYTCV
jgi:hypothetical protein